MGFYAPIDMAHAKEYATAAAHLNPMEIKRRKEAGNKNYSTQEVLAHLKSLETP